MPYKNKDQRIAYHKKYRKVRSSKAEIDFIHKLQEAFGQNDPYEKIKDSMSALMSKRLKQLGSLPIESQPEE